LRCVVSKATSQLASPGLQNIKEFLLLFEAHPHRQPPFLKVSVLSGTAAVMFLKMAVLSRMSVCIFFAGYDCMSVYILMMHTNKNVTVYADINRGQKRQCIVRKTLPSNINHVQEHGQSNQ
jgi:hypothetical protein